MRALATKSVYSVPILGILLLFYVPLLIVVMLSFWEKTRFWVEPGFTFRAYETLFTELRGNLMTSFEHGIIAGLVSLVLMFPLVYFMSRMLDEDRTTILLSIFAIPFFVSPLVKVIMLIPILGTNGLVNDVLLATGLIDSPITWLLASNTSVYIGTISTFMPFVLFAGYLSMEMIDSELVNAAQDLGARPLTSIRTVLIPLSIPGLGVGVLFVIAASMGESLFPRVLGDPNAISIGLMVERAYNFLDVPLASAIMVVSLTVYIALIVLLGYYYDIDKMFEVTKE